jgi:hypothetical protein
MRYLTIAFALGVVPVDQEITFTAEKDGGAWRQLSLDGGDGGSRAVPDPQ